MPDDICMCKGEGCPFKDECYRYTATPGPIGQSWFMTPPIEDGKCEYLMNVKKLDRRTYAERLKEINNRYG